MTVVAEVVTAGGILALIGLIFRFLWQRITKMEKKHCADLFCEGNQPRYVTTNTYNDKFEELKALLHDMDKKREKAKDEFTRGQGSIVARLIAIETQLKMKST